MARWTLVVTLASAMACAHDDQQSDNFIDAPDYEPNESSSTNDDDAEAEASDGDDDASESVAGPAAEAGGGDDFEAMLKAMAAANPNAVIPTPAKAAPQPAAQPKASATATPIATPVAADPEALWVFVDAAWVYAAPSTSAQRVRPLPYGTKVTAVGTAGDWVQIGEGQFLPRAKLTDRRQRFAGQQASSGPRQKVTGTGKPARGTRTVKSEVLAVRKEPRLDAPVVAYVNAGQSLSVVAEGWNGWTQIGPGRFVRTKYLNGAAQGPLGVGSKTYVVKSEALYVRSAPDRFAPVVGVVKSGETVRADQAPVDGWVQIGPRRFLRKKHLEAVGH